MRGSKERQELRCWCPAVLWSPSAARLRAQAVLFAAMGFKAIFKIISLTSSTIIINLARPQPAAVGFSLLPSSRMRVCLCHICERGGREGCCAAPPATPTHCTLDFYLQTAAGQRCMGRCAARFLSLGSSCADGALPPACVRTRRAVGFFLVVGSGGRCPAMQLCQGPEA